MSKLRVEVVVAVEAEEVHSYCTILITWQRTIVSYVVRRSIRGSVFDHPESVVEAQVDDQTNP